MPTFKQIRFPEIPTKYGGYRLIINREGEADFAQADADVLTLDQSLRIIQSLSDLAQEKSDDEGYPVGDAIEVALVDRKNYSGMSDGSPVSETIGSFIYERLFTDKSVKYKAWILFTGNGGEEKIFVGKIDPNAVPAQHTAVNKPYTADEEVNQIIRFQIISAVEDLRDGRMGNVKSSITTSDCQLGEFYGGLTLSDSVPAGHPNGISPFTSGNQRITDPYGQKYMHASPFWQDVLDCHVKGNLIEWYQWAGTASQTKYWDKIHGVSTTPDISLGGSWGIKISKVVEKIAAECGMEFDPDDLLSALAYYRQKVNNTTKAWEIKTDVIYAATDLYISYNVWFGVHIINGSNWNNPIRFQDNETCLNGLQRTADFLLSDLRFDINQTTGNPQIKFIPKGQTGDPIPQAWVDTLIDSKSEERISTADYVVVHNKQDDTKIKCPAGASGDEREYIIPFRIRRIGRTVDDQYYTFLGFGIPEWEFDGKFKVEEQWKCFCVGAYNYTFNRGDNRDGPVPLNDYWRGLCYVYIYDSNTSNNDVLPSNWTSINNDSNFAGFKAISLVLPVGEAIPDIPDDRQYNSRDIHAQYFAKETVGLRPIIVRNNIGVLADDGTFTGIKVGNEATFRFEGAVTTFELAGLRRSIMLREGKSEIKLVGQITFPTITELAIEEESGDETTSSSTTNNSTTTVVTTILSLSDALIKEPLDIARNKTKPAAGVDTSVAHGNNADGDVTGERFWDEGENESVRIAAPQTLGETYDFVLPEADGATGDLLVKTATGHEYAPVSDVLTGVVLTEPPTDTTNDIEPPTGVEIALTIGLNADGDPTKLRFRDPSGNITTIQAHDEQDEAEVNIFLPSTAPSLGKVLVASSVAAPDYKVEWGYAPHGSVYGDGFDSAVTFDGTTTVLGLAPAGGTTYTLNRDIFCTDITIDTTIIIETNGYRIFANGTLTNNGTIRNNGLPGVGAIGGVAGTANSVGAGTAGANGRNPGAGNGSNSSANNNGGGGQGGAGGIDGAGNTGGTAGAIGAIGAVLGGARSYHSYIHKLTGLLFGAENVKRVEGGTGGGGGAAGIGGVGGGGGAGGNVVHITAFVIDNTNGAIEAKGGNGAPAVAGNAGGGGGGGGGVIYLTYSIFIGNSASVAAGTFGAGAGAGAPGVAGSTGQIFTTLN